MAANALSEAQAAQGPMEEKVRNERSTFDHHKEVCAQCSPLGLSQASRPM